MHLRLTASLMSVLVLAVALAACGGGGNDRGGTSDSVLTKGLKWTVTVQQDSSGIVADAGDASTYDTKYDFHVTKAPTGAKGSWTVVAKQQGAQGPFAQGYQLHYSQGPGTAVTLESVSLAGKGKVPADQAMGVLGAQFPLETKITKRPTSRTVKTTADQGGSPGLPPALPSGQIGGSTGGGAPPATGGAPTAPSGGGKPDDMPAPVRQ